MRKIALIPAYRPDGELLDLISGLKQEGFELLVVDDGSGEEFASLFQTVQFQAAVLRHEENQGKGAALKTGLTYIRRTYPAPYVVVTVDADGQHKIPDVMRVSEEAAAHPDALVLGSRRMKGKVPLRSRFGNAVTRLVFRLTSGRRVYDTQTGLRAFSDRLLERVTAIQGQRYEYEMNVLVELARGGTELLEIPIETVYLHGNTSSHFDTVKDSYRIYKELLKFSMSSLICFCTDYLLFCLLVTFTQALTAANILARICSASLNYTLNRNMVFKSSGVWIKSAADYLLLVLFILFCNTLLVRGFYAIGISAYLAKIMAELLLFWLSWFMQHRFIFRRSNQE